jgi:hypothetical protein
MKGSWTPGICRKNGPTPLIRFTGCRGRLRLRFAIDYAKAEEDAKLLDAMLCYKQLTMVEQTFPHSQEPVRSGGLVASSFRWRAIWTTFISYST